MGERRNKPPSSSRRSIWIVALLLAAALGIRILYDRELAQNPFHDQPIIDAAEYYGWAKMIAGGEWLWQRVHIHGPAYPYLLAGLMRLGGSFDAFYFVQHLFGTAILYLVYDVGRILWGAPAGIVALAFAMLYARFLFLEGLLLAETLVALLDLLALRIALGLGLRRARPLAWGTVGLLIGLSAITRPTILAVVPALAYWSYRAGAPGAAWRRLAAVLAGIVIFLAPVFLRNVSIGDPVLLQANSGLNFYIGNRAGSDGLASVPPGTEWNAIERLADRAGAVRETDRDSFYYRRAFAEMAGEPLRALSRVAKRFVLFWGGWEVEISQDFDYFRERSAGLKMLFLPAAIIAPLALCGVLFAARSAHARTPELLPLLFVLSYLAAVLPFPYASRYRMPIFPGLVLFAGAAFVRFARSLRARSFVGREWGALAAAFLLLNFTPLSLPKKGIVRTHLHLGKMLYDRGDARGALAEYERALERDPEGADVWNDIGLAREELGDREGALAAYRRALRSAPDHGKARANVAGIYYQRGEVDSALAEMRKAVEAEPRNPGFLNNLGALLSRAGATEEALATLERGAALGPDNPEVLYNLAQTYEKVNRLGDAERVFRFLASKRETKEIRVRLGALAERSGRPEAAYTEYRRALEIDPSYPEGLRSLGVLLLRSGRRAEGITLLTKYLAARPSDVEIRKLLESPGR